MKKTVLATIIAMGFAGTASAITVATPAVDGDFGFIMGGAESMNSNLRRDDVDWYSFDVAPSATYVDIYTYERRQSGVDTEIGLFAADGMLIATDDDGIAFAGASGLSFGTGSGVTIGDMTFDGHDGGILTAGQYFVSVSRWNTNFSDGFGVDAPTLNARDRYGITIKSDVAAVPLPAALPLMGFAIAGLGALGARRKNNA